MHLARIALISAVWITTAFGQAPMWLPVSQVVDALEAQLKLQPRNRRLLQDVAAVHHLAFSVQVAEFQVVGSPGYIDVALPDRIARGKNGKLEWDVVGKRWSSPMLVHYAREGLIAYERALAHYPHDAGLWLGYAGLLEDVWAFCFAKPADQFPSEFKKIRVPFLREVYGVAFQLGLRDDFLNGTFGYVNFGATYPAALGTLRLEKSASPALSTSTRHDLEEYTRIVEARGSYSPPVIGCGGLHFFPTRPQLPYDIDGLVPVISPKR